MQSIILKMRHLIHIVLMKQYISESLYEEGFQAMKIFLRVLSTYIFIGAKDRFSNSAPFILILRFFNADDNIRK